jgi:hypothetical protein
MTMKSDIGRSIELKPSASPAEFKAKVLIDVIEKELLEVSVVSEVLSVG